ncbi:6642_t:CDS:2 [Scutellospora calospora]|uniref:6642_t:CDS:1 n=1 Tax=Scutellospora calospora TaxID=85575 RepID=A0ACA9LWY6_9GLOM|nr:6642_t:CDS:2 [Scutellospora calospora]
MKAECVASQSKWCKKCNTTNIDNRKHICSKCNEKLDMLATLQAESNNEFIQASCRHPIYHYIEIDYEEQLLRLYSEIRKIVELYSIISRSSYCNQHQGLDAILEEINKYLKALILPISTQRH